MVQRSKSSKMERIEILISKLNEQYQQNASADQMLVTLQLLQNELASKQLSTRTLGTSKVSVVMPPMMSVDPATYEKYAPRPAEKPQPQVQKETVLVDKESVSIVQ